MTHRLRVSCSFSRGKQDESISLEVSRLIEEMNRNVGTLTEDGLKRATWK